MMHIAADQVCTPPTGRRRHRSLPAVLPALIALPYPLIVDGFRASIGVPGTSPSPGALALAALLLLLMFAVPLAGFLHVMATSSRHGRIQSAEVRSRRLGYLVVAAPTLYCMVGVLQILAGSPVPDPLAWAILWGAGIILFLRMPLSERSTRPMTPGAGLRVIHGVTAAVLLVYLAFHLTNHLLAWFGEDAHSSFMEMGRSVYRAPLIEPFLVAAMLFQAGTGILLAWRWSAQRADFHRAFQVASGVFLSVFILGHMNSVFILARTFFGIETGWDFATGAPNGLLHDPWSVRLIPHYALGVFFIIAHLFSGLRVVLLAHGTRRRTGNILWAVGATFAALLSLAIMLAMCGMRLG